MKLLYLLHFYQPDFQFTHTLENVYKDSYQKIFEILNNSPSAKIIVNITGSTLKLYQRWGIGALPEDLRGLYKQGKIEFTATAFAHALLHFASPLQAERQVTKHIETLREMIDPSIECKYLYSPEMYVSDKVVNLAKQLQLKGVLVSRNSLPTPLKNKNIFQHKGLCLVRRNTNISRFCENHGVFSLHQLYDAIKKHDFDPLRPMAIVHDAEIIGHHFEKKVDLFRELMRASDISWLGLDDFIRCCQEHNISTIKEASWEQMPIRGKVIDPHWNNPKNVVHKAMWEVTNYVVETVESLKDKSKAYSQLQEALDYIQYSCQYWWASSYPYWSAEIVVNTMWRWFKLNADIYRALKAIKAPNADTFLRKSQALIFKVLQNLAKYEAIGWHVKNIAYYDKYILPKKKKGIL